MSDKTFAKVTRRIRAVASHVGTFEHSFPKILRDTSQYTRSHLIVMRECLPDVKVLVRYAADTVPTVARMVGWADQGMADLVRASGMLNEIRTSTEAAVNEIFRVLDHLDPLLEQAAQADGVNGETQQTIAEAREQFLLILNSLQFQDITAQQIEATKSLLVELGCGLGKLLEGFGGKADELPTIDVRAGTFDESARFDRSQADMDQIQIDKLLQKGEMRSDAAANPREAEAEREVVIPQEADGQTDFANDGGGSVICEGSPAADPEEDEGEGEETVSQSDIDSLLQAAL